MMFKNKSCAQEVWDGMDTNLNTVSELEKIDNPQFLLVNALEELQKAAEVLERSGQTKRATEVTELMVSLGECPCHKEEHKDESSKEDAKNTFMFFGFDADDLDQMLSEEEE